MQIWNYHPVTHELLGSGVADPNPVEEGSWILPAFSTAIAPPAPQTGFAQTFNGSSWVAVPDHRGETWWPTTQPYNDVPGVLVMSLGDPSLQGLSNTEPPGAPVVAQPIVVTAWQIRKALSSLGLRAAVEAYVAAADQDTKDGWQYSATFEQAHSMVEAAATALGKTQADVDALFGLAKTL